MTQALRFTLAQINPVAGDLTGNAEKILDVWRGAAAETDLVIFPELALCAYPVEDLIVKPVFMAEIGHALAALSDASRSFKPAALIGAPYLHEGKIYNAACLIESGAVKSVVFKHHLPDYGVFDETRIFAAGPLPGPVEFRGSRLGIMICEDMWFPDAAAALKKQGCNFFVVLNASPYDPRNKNFRVEQAEARAREHHTPLLYINQIGGQDELVFDGGSFIMDSHGDLLFELQSFAEDIQTVRASKLSDGGWDFKTPAASSTSLREEAMYSALVLGLRDYVRKNDFPGVLVGLSGGIDSALAAAIAVDALGPASVDAVMMPSRYTSAESIKDARAVAQALGIPLDHIPIKWPVFAFEKILKKFLPARVPGLTFENIQSRTRGLILMALSNASRKMVVSTGNKSELATGYATLYGDMCGGFNPLKDLYKTQVYRLAAWRNSHVPGIGLGPAGTIIPTSILNKAPSAELRPNQKDQDSLPPYDILDAVLYGLIEENLSVEDITARGHDHETVMKVWRLLDGAEYKRRQSAPGTKVTPKAFGRDRRYPMTNKFLKTIEKSGL